MSKHVPPPTGTPIAAPVEKSQEALYVNTPITPEEAFQAIGRLRKHTDGYGSVIIRSPSQDPCADRLRS